MEAAPDAGVVAEEEGADAILLGTVVSGDQLFAGQDGAVFKDNAPALFC